MDNPLVFTVIATSFVGAAASYLGSLMITRKMALVADALGHVALPGIGLALVFGFDPGIGAFALLALALILIGWLGDKTKLSTETVVGIAFVTSLAAGFLIVPQADILESLIGDLSKLTPLGAGFAIACSLGAIALVRRIYRGIILANISEELARVQGISIQKQNCVFLFAIALLVSVGIRVTGSLLIGAMVIVPPAAARLCSSNLRHYSWASILLGAVSGFSGVALSSFFKLPPGPMIVITSALVFMVALAAQHAKNH